MGYIETIEMERKVEEKKRINSNMGYIKLLFLHKNSAYTEINSNMGYIETPHA